MERHELWISLTSSEAFKIATIGLTTAVEKLVHPPIITSTEILELLRLVASLYPKFDRRVSITSLADLFSDHVRCFYASLRMSLQTGDGDPPLRLPTITPIFTSALKRFEMRARQKCSNHLIQESDHGRTGSIEKSNHCIDLTGKQITVGKDLAELKGASSEEPSKEMEQIRPEKAPRTN